MPSWTDLSTASTVAALVAAATDFLLLHREKEAIYSRLVRWWKRVDKSRVPDIPRLTATRILAAINKVFGSRLTRRTLAASVLVSVALTSAAANLGVYLQGLNDVPDFGYQYFPPEVYAINFIFDGATVLVSVAILGWIASVPSFRGLLLAGLNLFVAVCLAVCCAVTTDWYAVAAADLAIPTYSYERAKQDRWAVSFVRGYLRGGELDGATAIVAERWRPSLAERVEWTVESGRYWLTSTGCCRQMELAATVVYSDRVTRVVARGPRSPMNLGGILYASTTLIPVVLLFAMMATAVLAKVVLAVSRSAVVRMLRAAVQVDPRKDPREFMPATLSALLCVAFVFLVKAAAVALGTLATVAGRGAT